MSDYVYLEYWEGFGLIERVFSKKKEDDKMLNGKFICTKGKEGCMTKGKIYEFKNGYVIYDKGISSSAPVNSIGDFNRSFATQISKIEEDLLPEPSKSLLKSGFRVVYKTSRSAIRYVLIEADSLNDEKGAFRATLSDFNDDLTPKNVNFSPEIIEIWDGDTLIAKRKEKSDAQLKLEELEKKQRELADEIARVRKSL